MNASTVGILLTSLLVACHANLLSFDVQVAELVDGKEVKEGESEVFMDESYLTPEPPTIDMEYGGEEDYGGDEEDDFVGRETIDMSEINSGMAFGKQERHHPDEHMNFAIDFGSVMSSPIWSAWTCCRPAVKIQSRQRIIQAPKIEMEYKRCSRDFCKASSCNDNKGLCTHFITTMGRDLCNKDHMMMTFMSHHCPKTCNFCDSDNEEPIGAPRPSLPWRPKFTRPTRRPFVPTTLPWWKTRKPTARPVPTRRPRPTTTLPWWATRKPTPKPQVVDSKLVKVTILSHNRNPPHPSYQFSIENPVRVSSPWQKISNNGRELSSFYLYRMPTDTFKVPIRFCSSNDPRGNKKWSITKTGCKNGWNQEFELYASLSRTKSATLYYVGNRGRPLWSSRVSTRFPSNGYTSSLFYFYGPKPEGKRPTPRPRPTFPSRPTPRPRPTFPRPFPTTTRRPIRPTRPTIRPTRPTIRPTRPTIRPFPTTTRRPNTGRPPVSGPQPTSTFNRECLETHNFFRAVHNVPPLRWSKRLADTAQSWADALKRIAPERPNQLRQPGERTRNWPHSDSGKGYRDRGIGENIAWDLSSDGSPAKESVLRWYAEIFYYNRKHPTHAPAPDKPVGHLTQLLWKDTKELGCGVATTTVSQYKQLSTWTVSHYGPGGNIRYGNNIRETLKLYNEQVPEARQGSCMTNSGACNNGNQCMAFGPARAACTCPNNKALCTSNKGCIAWCQNRRRSWPWKEECKGNRECKCTDKGAVCT